MNLGIGGTTSTGLVHLRDEIQRLNPSALIVYYGHNEVRQFRLMNQHVAISEWQYKIQRWLWHSSAYSLLYQWLQPRKEDSPPSTTKPSPQSTLLTDEAVVQLATWNYESNMRLICQSVDVPIIFLTPPTNYPFAPMIAVNSLPETTDEIQALIDPHPEATTIHSAIKAVLPTIAAECGATHWDVDDYFHQNSPDRTSANGLFWDELHPSATGHEWIAIGLTQWLNTL